MFENIENLKLISVSSGISTPKRNRTRKTSGFVLRTRGETKFTFDDKVIFVKAGQMIFIPKGAVYDFEIVSPEPSEYTLFSFEESFQNPAPKVFSLENFPDANFIAGHATQLWNLGTSADKFKVLSLFFNLLSYLSGIESADYSAKQKLEIIAPAVDFLKRNIFSPSLSANKLHSLCGISDTYFRKIFITNFGMSPQAYIISKRLSAAMAQIDTGHFLTVAELSEAVGYRDPLYFSRAFKQKYGVSPSEFLR